MNFDSLKFVLFVSIGFCLFQLSPKLNAQSIEALDRGEQVPPNPHFTGDVWIKHFVSADSVFPYGTVLVNMNPGAKLNWHSHPGGQQLLFTAGRGLYQERGKEIQVMHPGDVIRCSPDVEHWHAATPKDAVGYLAMSGPGRTQWAEPIDSESYTNLNVDSLEQAVVASKLLQLSKDKWKWMADKDVDQLTGLFHDQSNFVHMGGSWGKQRELDIIESGNIHYKQADIHEASVEVIDDTAILLNRITLLAVVGGKEVTNPFMVTEVYKKEGETWKLGSMSFTKLLR